jgi:hypothetical protein
MKLLLKEPYPKKRYRLDKTFKDLHQKYLVSFGKLIQEPNN